MSLLLFLAPILVQTPPAQLIDPEPYYCAPVDANYCDHYVIDGPNAAPGLLYPLIVMFHGSHEEPGDLHPGAQAFIDAAKNWSQGPRQYFVVMHDGGYAASGGVITHDLYGSETFQRATEAVINEVVATWPIDQNRIYGYGHSTGGGQLASFAARHQDPTKPTFFSAIVCQSGTVSTIRILAKPWPSFHNMLKFLYQTTQGYSFGADPAADFIFQRATTLDLPFDYSVQSPLDYDLKWNYHMAHNLRWVPCSPFISDADRVNNLKDIVEPVEAWQAFMSDPDVDAPDREIVPAVAIPSHAWSDVLPSNILTYFDQASRTKTGTLGKFSKKPVSGYHEERILFGEDNVRHHCFSVERTNPSLFGRLPVRCYPISSTFNGMTIGAAPPQLSMSAENIAKTYIHLDYFSQMQWNDPSAESPILNAKGGDIGTIVVLGVTPQPTFVYHLVGQTWRVTTLGTDWSYSGTSLSLFEKNGVQREWKIQY